MHYYRNMTHNDYYSEAIESELALELISAGFPGVAHNYATTCAALYHAYDNDKVFGLYILEDNADNAMAAAMRALGC